jgi:V8-like Glu-specific endopeptidase
VSRALSSAVAGALAALLVLAAVPAFAAQSINFDGIVALSNCSGAIVRWSGSAPSDQALMLTNGHCFEFMGADQAVANEPAVRDVYLMKPDGSAAGTIETTTLVYATMSRTDVALYGVGLTYKQLHTLYGVDAITIGRKQPTPRHKPISIISGYWSTEYDCNLDGFAWRLHEDVWTWQKSLRYTYACDTIDGTSGSPVLNANRVEIGINNTGNEDGQQCTLDNPCEENRHHDITVDEGRNYGQETWIFYTCLSNNALDLAKPGCKLPQPQA